MSSLDTVKEMLDLALKAKNHDLYSRINEVSKDLIESQQENLALKKKVMELEQTLKTKESLKFEDHVYWLIEDGKKDGPYCPKCWDAESKMIRLRIFPNAYRKCPNCQNGFDSATNRSSEAIIPPHYSFGD